MRGARWREEKAVEVGGWLGGGSTEAGWLVVREGRR